MAIQEIRSRLVDSQPIFVAQEIVHFIRENECFHRNSTFGTEALNEVCCFYKIHIPVIISDDEKHGRIPEANIRNW